MLAIFSDYVESIMEVFMDAFLIYVGAFDLCLDNLAKVLRRCKEVNLVLNWEKHHFMVQKGVVLGYVVSHRGIENGKPKIEVIKRLPTPLLSKG